MPKRTRKSEGAGLVVEDFEKSGDLKNVHIDNELSEYERLRQENIKRNQEFLGTLGLDEVKHEAVDYDKATKRGITQKKREIELPVRRSSRVTIEKLREEIIAMESSVSSEDPKLLEDKKAQLAIMISQKQQAQAYELQMEVVSSGPSKRLPRDSISVARAENKPEDASPNWVQPLIELLRSVSIDFTHSSDAETDLLLQPAHSSSVRNREKSAEYLKQGSSHSASASDPVLCQPEPDYIRDMRKLTVKEEDVAKLTEARISTVWLHPSGDKIICAAGDKNGNLGIWDVDSRTTGVDGVFKYRPHVEGINKLFSWAHEPSRLFSCSYDGTIRSLDLESQSFTLAFEAPEDYGEMSFSDVAYSDKLRDCLYVGRGDGSVCVVDIRQNVFLSANKYEWTSLIHGARVNSLQLHPQHEHLLLSSGAKGDGLIAVHDLRNRPTGHGVWKPLLQLKQHSKSINAMACSPDGHFLVSVSQDNTIRTYTNFTSGNLADVKSVKTHHDNHTGRWLSTFRPAWDPKQPHMFAMGSMERPRQVELFRPSLPHGKDGVLQLDMLVALRADYLGSVCSRNAFHPHRNIIAGGNSSGRVHIMR